MNREEILKKSRAEKNDEGDRNIQSKAFELSAKIVLGILLIIFISDLITGKQTHWATIILLAFAVGDMFMLYKYKGRKKSYFVLGILAILILVIYIVVMLLDLFGML